MADDQLAERLRGAVARRRDELVELIGALVRERSLLGAEEGAQRLIAERLSALGFSVERVPVQPPADGEDPTWGYPPGSYEGRTCVAGRVQGAAGARSLHLSGHIDVVPVESPEQWQHDPWGGEISEGRLWGRGAGDMKAGLAAYLVAAAALLEVCGQPQGDLLFSSVIEEECTGNGMKAVLASGYDADGTLIGEPSDLRLMHAGVGVIWARLAARGAGAHAAFDSGASSSERVLAAVEALRGLERALNERDGADDGLDAVFFAGHEHPFRLNVGTLAGGVWPSSEPTRAEARVRLAFGRELSPGARSAARPRHRAGGRAGGRGALRRIPRARLLRRPRPRPRSGVARRAFRPARIATRAARPDGHHRRTVGRRSLHLLRADRRRHPRHRRVGRPRLVREPRRRRGRRDRPLAGACLTARTALAGPP